MRSDSSTGLRVAAQQTCVVFDKKTGRIAHIHDCITFEGAEIPSKEAVEARAMQLTRQFAAKRAGIKLDRLEVIHMSPDELEHVLSPRVDVKRRTLVRASDVAPLPSKEKKKRAAKRQKLKRPKKRR